jgi:hypothetical protein
MEPGTSAVIAIAEDHVIERLENGVAGYERIARIPSAPKLRWRSRQRQRWP